jgi:hypothetical protein
MLASLYDIVPVLPLAILISIIGDNGHPKPEPSNFLQILNLSTFVPELCHFKVTLDPLDETVAVNPVGAVG